MTLGELIEELGGNLVQGTAEQVLFGVNSAELAHATDLVFAEDAASAAQAVAGNAGAIVMKPGCAEAVPPHKSVIEIGQPRLWFARAAKLLAHVTHAPAVHPSVVFGKNVTLGQGVAIAPGVILGDQCSIGAGTRVEAGAVIGEGVQIGKLCHIYPRVVIYPETRIGNSVMIHAGAVLGADGFGYVRDPETGAYAQFPQQGTLAIEDDVEIGANSTIDRGALGNTRIGRGTKIDNLVHVGHNCDIGEDVILVALTGISGSSTVGNGAVLAGQVGIGDHAHVGPGVILGGQAGVFSGSSVSNEGLTEGTVLWGTPARPLKQVLREQALVARLAKDARKDLE